MCMKSGKSVDHLLLHCEMANALWNAIFNLERLAWVMPNRVIDLFVYWKGKFDRLENAAMWKMVSSYLMWCLWRKRNYQNFEDRKQTVDELTDFFLKSLYHWASALDLNICSYHVLVFFPLLACCFSCTLLVYLGCIFCVF